MKKSNFVKYILTGDPTIEDEEDNKEKEEEEEEESENEEGGKGEKQLKRKSTHPDKRVHLFNCSYEMVKGFTGEVDLLITDVPYNVSFSKFFLFF